jgi:transcriptional regulator with XRE-family HTH domain
MKDLGAKIKERRVRLGWSVTKLATLAEISQSFLSKLENGKTSGSWETYIKIAGALGTSIDSFLISRSNVERAPLDWREIPVLDYREAGSWTIDSSLAQLGQHETIMTNLEHPPSTFALRLRDDSNAPKYQPDDIVVISPAIPPRFGDMVVAANLDGDSLFSQYRDGGINEHGDKVFELHPLNPIYAPMRSDRLQLAIVGTMVEHRSYRRR